MTEFTIGSSMAISEAVPCALKKASVPRRRGAGDGRRCYVSVSRSVPKPKGGGIDGSDARERL